MRPIDVLRRPAVALPALLAAVLVVAGTVAVLGSGDDRRRPADGSAAPPGPTVPPQPTAVPGSTETSTAAATGTTAKAPAPTASTRPPATERPAAAPWLAPAVQRSNVPAPFLEAWERAGNKSTCALLIPSDTGPRMEGATPSFAATPQDRGWDIVLRKEAGIVEILGLFRRADQPDDRAPAAFTRRWSDGSELRYGAEAGAGPDVSADPEANPFEGVLTIPTQDCAYRIYDTLGLSHFEFVVDHLRFVAGAP